MSSAGVGPLCFLKSTVNTDIYQDILEHFMLPSADKLYGDADFIFQQDLAPAHTAKGTKSWFNDHGVTVLDWPANSPDLNPIENLWGIIERKKRDTRSNHADDLKAAIKATWTSKFCVFIICKPYSSKFQEIKAWNISLCVMNLYNIWVSLSEMSDQKYWRISWYSIFFRLLCMLSNLSHRCQTQSASHLVEHT